MRFVITRDVEDFAGRAGAFLAERIDRNVLASVLLLARGGRYDAPGPFAVGVDEHGAVRAAALRTPPRHLLVTELDDSAADALVEAWLREDPLVPGVGAEAATAGAIAAAWRRCTGGETRCRMRQAVHELTEVRDPPRPAVGRLREATAADRDLLVGWERAFAAEAGVHGQQDAVRSVNARLGRGGQFVWDDRGPVSTVGLAPEVARVVRIGPVYTPPERRQRGYAGSAVAAVSRRALEAGVRRCMLHTDLANPTSNKIYASVGFRAFGDWEDHDFRAAGSVLDA